MTRQPKVKFYTDKRKLWRWSLIAVNGKIMADCGEGYSSFAKAVKAAINASGYLRAAVAMPGALDKPKPTKAAQRATSGKSRGK